MGGWWCPHLLSLTTPRPPQRYPTSPRYYSQNTNCLSLEGPWKSALKADPGARSEPTRYNPINTARVQSDGWPYDPPPQDAMVRPNGTVHAPDLMGIREYGLGRVALLAVYDQFLFGSGEKWLFDKQILSAGNGTHVSEMGKLLRNTLNWLAAPSLGNSSSGVGGYAPPPDRLTPYNDRPAVWGALNTTHYHYDKAALSADPAAGDGTAVFDGLFGAQTVHGGGQVRKNRTLETCIATLGTFGAEHGGRVCDGGAGERPQLRCLPRAVRSAHQCFLGGPHSRVQSALHRQPDALCGLHNRHKHR